MRETKVRVDSGTPDKLKVGMHQGSVLSPFLLKILEVVENELVNDGVLNELLGAYGIALISETSYRLRHVLRK